MSELQRHTPNLAERRYSDHSLWIFWCPACGCCHSVPVGGGSGRRWSFNGKVDSPTFTPSLRMSTNMNEEENGRLPDGQMRTVCHLNVTDGQIVYHGDNPHKLNGKTVPMVPIPDSYEI